MTFVNEYISEEDKKGFYLEEIDKMFIVGGTNARDWTVDHEREMYLRNVARGREDISHRSTWTFYWHSELIILELENISTNGIVGGVRHGHKRLRKIKIPSHLEGKRNDILSDLKKALTVYKDGGVFATATSYTLTLDV